MDVIDIVIVTYNAKSKLKRCLQGLQRHTHALDYRLTIINNNSNDGTSGYLKRYNGKANVINNKKNFGFSKGANIGIRNTSNEYIVFLDDDAEVTGDWLDKLYDQIKDKPEVGIVGCKVLSPNKRILCSSVFITNRIVRELGRGEIDKGQRDYIREVDGVNGTCWLVRRELIKKVGYFDERFFPSQHEDVDYCLRTRLAGYKIIYNGEAEITHHHLFRDGGKKQLRKNWQKFFKKWEDILRKFPLKNSHPADRYMASGLSHLEKNRFEQALTEFKKIDSIDKRFSEPFYLGIALKGIGRYDSAIKQFKKVLGINPSSFLAHHNLACVYKKCGLIKEAGKEAQKALKYAI